MARRRRRRMAMAAAGLATVAAPLVLGQQAAGAAANTVTGSSSITFTGLDRQTVTCTVNLRATHDTDLNELDAFATSSGNGPSCRSDVLFVLTLSMKDEDGDLRQAEGQAYNSEYVWADHAVSSTSATVVAYFNDCDFGSNPSCQASVTVSPK
jgi:hypothetical protein